MKGLLGISTNLWLYYHRHRKSDQRSDKEQTENMGKTVEVCDAMSQGMA